MNKFMKKVIDSINVRTVGITLAVLAVGILIGHLFTSLEVSRLKSEIKELTASNDFKRELIHAYEKYYDADDEEDAGYLWAPIDSLYRSQI